MRALKILTVPFKRLFALAFPVAYARLIGVEMKGKVRIYGSSYEMFSSEPYLVTLGDNVYISVGAKFVCHDGSTLPFRRLIPDLELAAEILVGSNVFIGMGALILPGVVIGDDCVVGANAVVTKDVQPGTIVAGNPARLITTTDEFLRRAQERSLRFGHLTGKAKVDAYKHHFGKR